MKALAALFLVVGVLAPAALAVAGQQHPHQSARSTESGHHAARPQPHAPAVAPTMQGLSAAQVLSGPLPMFPSPAGLPFSATPLTYLPHKGISPFLRPRSSIVIGGYAFSPDTPSEPTPAMAGRADAPMIDPPVAAQPPDAQPRDRPPPSAPPPDVPPSVAPNLAPVTLYVIPGCYAGDRPPADGMLPAGCDVAKMRTIRR